MKTNIWTAICAILLSLFFILFAINIGLLINNFRQENAIRKLNEQQSDFNNILQKEADKQRVTTWKEINAQELAEQKRIKKMAKKQREQRMNQLSENSDTLTLEQLIEKYDLPPTDLGW